MHKLRYFLPPLPDFAPGTIDLYHPRLRFVAVPRDNLQITYDFEDLVRPVVDAMFKKAGRDVQIQKNYVAVPVHEVQVTHIQDKFKEAEIYPEDISLDSFAQQSLRSRHLLTSFSSVLTMFTGLLLSQRHIQDYLLS